jgi:hypothetical protein
MAQRGYFAEFFFLCGLCASVRNFSRRRSRAARHFGAIAHFNCKDFFLTEAPRPQRKHAEDGVKKSGDGLNARGFPTVRA